MEMREGGFTFGFSKVVTKKLLNTNGVLRDDSTKDALEEVDFVTGLVGSKIQGTLKKPKKIELVIPLISQSDGWVVGSSSNGFGPVITFGNIGSGSSEKSTLDDYDRVPVSDFGLAMLRGMGWKKNEGIGLRNKRVVEMKEPDVRPRGLGLGAERPQSNKDILPPSKSKDEVKELTIKVGAFAIITKGSNKGLYGQIESLDEDNNRVIIKLTIGSQMIAVSKFFIDLVDEEEYKKKSKILNNEKYEEYKLKQELRNTQRQSENENILYVQRKSNENKSGITKLNENHISQPSSPGSDNEPYYRKHHHHHHHHKRHSRKDKDMERVDYKKQRRDHS